MQRQRVIREDICFAAMEVAVEPAAGKVTVSLSPKKPGIVLVKPASYKGCTNPRIGVIAAFTPPVTG